MTLRQQVGQLLVFGGVIGGLGREQDHDVLMAAIEAGEVGGVFLGYPHFRDPDDARRMIGRLRERAPGPLFVATDFESGPGYNCAAGCAHFPYLMGLGFIDDLDVTRRAAEVTARQALAMGVNWLFSPCVDVNLQPDNPIIGIRAFGETPEKVARMGVAFVEGCRDVGVLCTAKHFPSTGNTRVDSHVGFVQDAGDLETWERQSLPPFVAAIEAGVPSVMTGHVAMPFLDRTGVAATFSRPILHDVLRRRLGFEGILISDSLGMGGAKVGETQGDRCVQAFKAGCDVLLTTFSPDIYPAFEKALSGNRALQAQFDQSLARVAKAREKLAKLPPAEFHPDDEAFAFEVGRRAAHVRKDDGVLPLRRGSLACLTQWRNQESEYFPREPGILSQFQHEVHCFDPAALLAPLSRECPPAEHAQILARIGDRRSVVLSAIVKNYARDPYRGTLSEGTAALVRTLADKGKEVVLVSFGSPYAALACPKAKAVICTGGDTLGAVHGALELLFGPERDII